MFWVFFGYNSCNQDRYTGGAGHRGGHSQSSSQRHGADQLSSCQAAQATQICSSRGSGALGEAPLAPNPAAHPSQLERLWRT